MRAVLFDLDDTLFDHRLCALEALDGVRGCHPALMAMERAALDATHARILEDLHLEVLAGRLVLDAARVERFRRLYAAAGIEADADLAVRTATTYRDRYKAAHTAVRGAAALLAGARDHATVVVVSNNLLDEQRAKLRNCALDRFVDVLVVSEEAGVSKPDPGIFRIALERAGVEAGGAVMIGDSWTNDVEGARAAGIRAVWFNRDGRPAPDPTVRTLRSLEPTGDALRVILGELTPGLGS